MKLAKSETEEAVAAAPIRPQTPKAPFPYLSTDIVFENKEDAVSLAGTLTVPDGDGPFPAVVLINGSGGHDRDVNILNHKFFLVVADHLRRNGIAVLRFDERGIGKSNGDHSMATTVDLARDVEFGVNYLLSQPKIDNTKVGLYGHSEGGLIAPMIASRRPDVAWIVMVAGPGVAGNMIIMNQGQLIARASGAPNDAIEIGRAANEKIFSIVAESIEDADILTKLENGLDDFVEGLTEDQQKLLGDVGAIRSNLKKINSPWFRYFLTYEPAPALQKLACPVLVLNGEMDLQVDPNLNIPPIKQALSKNERAEFHVLPKLNHMMQTCEKGTPDEYSQIEETCSPVFMNLVSDWIKKQ